MIPRPSLLSSLAHGFSRSVCLSASSRLKGERMEVDAWEACMVLTLVRTEFCGHTLLQRKLGNVVSCVPRKNKKRIW